jgi:hypothetical protein
MNVKFSFRHLFNVAIVVISAMIVVTALGYESQAALLPLIVAVPTLIMSIALTILEFKEDRKAPAQEEKEEGAGKEEAKSTFAKELNVSIWVIGLFVSLYLFGFVATTFFYTFLTIKVRSGFGWKVSLGVSAGTLAFLYILLIYALDVELYQGVVVIALRKAILGY